MTKPSKQITAMAYAGTGDTVKVQLFALPNTK